MPAVLPDTRSPGGSNMADARKVIITCAVTGSIHTPTMTPHLPITPEQIASDAIAAAEAGAAILHLHARDPRDGHPTPDPEVFKQFVPAIMDATDAVINITTGGSQTMTLDERLAGPLAVKPEMCSCNMGSMNFGLYHLIPKYKTWKYDWEPQYLEASRAGIFKNTFADIERLLKTLGDEHGLVKPPLFVQTIFGILGGIGADPENLVHMRRIANKLFGDDYQWSILAAGRHQMNLATMGAVMGGNVRVGLEDSIWLGPGQLAEGNADQVRKIRRILEEQSDR